MIKTHRQSIGYQNFNQARIEFRSGWNQILIKPEPIVPWHVLVLGAKLKSERLK